MNLSVKETLKIIVEEGVKLTRILFEKDLEKLVKQAYDAGHLAACWEDGGWPTNEQYEKSEADLKEATKTLIEKYYDKAPDSETK